jgi:hypothetical protein
MPLYHGSGKQLDVGARMKARTKEGTFPRPIELVMEAARPQGVPSRLSSFFLVERPEDVRDSGGSSDYIYEVVPIGLYSKHHFGWMSRVYNALIPFVRHRAPEEEKDAAAPLLLHLAEWSNNYWEGVPYRAPSREPRTVWEFLAPEILVERDIRVG